MTRNVQITLDEYLLFLKESASNGRSGVLFKSLGLLFLFAMCVKISVSDQILAADIGLIFIGLIATFLQNILFLYEKRKLLGASYLNDLLQPYKVEFSEFFFRVNTEDQEFEISYSELEGAHELNNFYVIVINEFRHFPIPKNQISESDFQFLMSKLHLEE